MIMFLLASLALADDSDKNQDSDRKIVYRQKTEIDFEGLEIEGILQKPQSSLIIDRKKASFNPLIKLRTNWSDEIESSTDEIK
jgi:hypothetical protein